MQGTIQDTETMSLQQKYKLIMNSSMKNKSVLLTGGTGYVGSHVAKYLMEQGFTVYSIDRNLDSRPFANKYGNYFKLDYTVKEDRAELDEMWKKYNFDAVIHLAANSLVGPSVTEPAKYYKNNVIGTIKLLNLAIKNGTDKFIFTSTSSVYGEGHNPPIVESDRTQPLSSYGRSKLMIEGVLKDYARAYGLKSTSMRLFNVCGSSPDAQIGEVRIKPTHLIPNIVEVAAGRKSHFSIFGTDYDTPDGTAIRDYTHVWDVARAFKLAYEYLDNAQSPVAEEFNIGAGKGFSVREVVQAMEKSLGRSIPIKEEPRREGDPSHVAADVTKAEELLSWKPQYSEIDVICQDTVKWLESNNYKEINLEKLPA